MVNETSSKLETTVKIPYLFPSVIQLIWMTQGSCENLADIFLFDIRSGFAPLLFITWDTCEGHQSWHERSASFSSPFFFKEIRRVVKSKLNFAHFEAVFFPTPVIKIIVWDLATQRHEMCYCCGACMAYYKKQRRPHPNHKSQICAKAEVREVNASSTRSQKQSITSGNISVN